MSCSSATSWVSVPVTFVRCLNLFACCGSVKPRERPAGAAQRDRPTPGAGPPEQPARPQPQPRAPAGRPAQAPGLAGGHRRGHRPHPVHRRPRLVDALVAAGLVARARAGRPAYGRRPAGDRAGPRRRAARPGSGSRSTSTTWPPASSTSPARYVTARSCSATSAAAGRHTSSPTSPSWSRPRADGSGEALAPGRRRRASPCPAWSRRRTVPCGWPPTSAGATSTCWPPCAAAGPADLALSVDNEANLAALGELYTGGAGGARSFVQRLRRDRGRRRHRPRRRRCSAGPTAGAARSGTCAIRPDGPPCSCGARGCLEQIAGQEAILRAAGLPTRGHDAWPASPASRRSSGSPRRVDADLLGALPTPGTALGVAVARRGQPARREHGRPRRPLRRPRARGSRAPVEREIAVRVLANALVAGHRDGVRARWRRSRARRGRVRRAARPGSSRDAGGLALRPWARRVRTRAACARSRRCATCSRCAKAGRSPR